jgi:hypothetical protein
MVAVANGKASSRAQNVVGKWVLMPTDFSDPGGELTPALKLKRSVAVLQQTITLQRLRHFTH